MGLCFLGGKHKRKTLIRADAVEPPGRSIKQSYDHVSRRGFAKPEVGLQGTTAFVSVITVNPAVLLLGVGCKFDAGADQFGVSNAR